LHYSPCEDRSDPGDHARGEVRLDAVRSMGTDLADLTHSELFSPGTAFPAAHQQETLTVHRPRSELAYDLEDPQSIALRRPRRPLSHRQDGEPVLRVPVESPQDFHFDADRRLHCWLLPIHRHASFPAPSGADA